MLTVAESETLIGAMLDGAMDDAHAIATLTEWSKRGETAEELLGAVQAIMVRAKPFRSPAGALDVCGTGGDGAHSFNISTCVAFVVAACGVVVVKHGNRGVSSRSGSSDVLDALGISNGLSDNFWHRCVDSMGIAFLFAPHYHPGLVRMAPIRKHIGVRTLFNVLGPLCNPAGIKRQFIGVYSDALVDTVAQVMLRRGMELAWVVHGADGGDEMNISGASRVAKVGHSITLCHIMPEDAGLPMHDADALRGGTPLENALALQWVLQGQTGGHRDAVLLNAASALLVAGKYSDLADAAQHAAEAIDSGRASALLMGIQTMAHKELHG